MTLLLKKQPTQKPLRDNVVAFILNKRGHVLAMKRAGLTNHWQLPQGGVDKGETKYAAVLREAREEVGLKKLSVMGVVHGFHSYEWPKHYQFPIEPYRGQQQTVFFLRHDGRDSDVKIDQREASAYRWVHVRDLVKTVAPVRRVMIRKALGLYQDLFTK